MEVVGWLESPEAAESTHDAVERAVLAMGRESLRQAFQDHADVRAMREVRPEGPVVGADGVERTRVERGHERVLVTVVGKVWVRRWAFRAGAKGVGNLYPADAVWNMPVGMYSHEMRRLVMAEVVRGSFESAQAAIARVTGVTMSKRQIEALSVTASVDSDAFYRDAAPDAAAQVDEAAVVVLTSDAKGVVMRPEGMRKMAAKQAEEAKAKPSLSKRTASGCKPHQKRMAQIACAYYVKPVVRAPGDVIVGVGDDPDRETVDGPKAHRKWCTVSLKDEVTTVVKAMFDEAERRDPEHTREWVGLVDGNLHQIRVIKAEAKRRGITLPLLIDFVHVAEYVWSAAWTFHHKTDPTAQAWVDARLLEILRGNTAAVVADMREQAEREKIPPSRRFGLNRCVKYLRSKAEAAQLDYHLALEKGWPIATGVVEGACRYLVNDRMDITGARWGLDGAEAILKLRAHLANDDRDAYWAYHLRQQHETNHQSRYQQLSGDYELAG